MLSSLSISQDPWVLEKDQFVIQRPQGEFWGFHLQPGRPGFDSSLCQEDFWVRRGHGNPLQYSCLENTHGQRSSVGYSPGGCKEPDMTERLSSSGRMNSGARQMNRMTLVVMGS